jgi:AcrR family transcriptional regulator
MAKRARRPRKPEAAAAAPKTNGAATPDHIIDETMKLIAGRGWRNVALADIAAASGLSLAQLYAIFPSKGAVLRAFELRINEQTLAGGTDATDTVRDRLFELVMRRLDALAPHKTAVRALLRDLPRDPVVALCGGPRFLGAMRWMAEAAGVDTEGIGGLLRIKGLAAVYLTTLRAWLNDETTDNSKTLAALDRALKQAEFFARSIPGFLRRPAPSAA